VANHYRIIPISKVSLPKTLQDSSYYLDNQEKFGNYKFKTQKLRFNFNSKGLAQKLFEKQKGICPFCENSLNILDNENTEIHHVYPLNLCKNKTEKAIAKKLINLQLLHQACHKTIHSNEKYYSINS